MEINHLTNTRFDSLPIDESILQGLSDAGFSECTPIQAASLPLTLQQKNIIGQASTGTGKTAAFLVAVLQKLITAGPPENKKQLGALVLAPTRELAIQIYSDAEKIAAHTGIKLGIAYGGAPMDKQMKQFDAGVDLLIATPGRAIDFFKRRLYNIRNLQAFVLDEADRMFDLGFISDIRFLMRQMSPASKRLNLLFTATLSYRVSELAYEHLDAPEVVKIEAEEMTPEKINQSVFFVSNEEKISFLIGLLNKIQPQRCIIFINTKHEADKINRYLVGNDKKSGVLSGDVPQKKRQSLVESLGNGELPILIATDVAARGLHIPDIDLVINYDLPQDPEDYVHRIGRTGRIGQKGKAISLVCESYAYHLPEIEEYIGKPLDRDSLESEFLTEPKPPIAAAPRKPRKGGPAKNAGRRPEGNRNSRRR